MEFENLKYTLITKAYNTIVVFKKIPLLNNNIFWTYLENCSLFTCNLTGRPTSKERVLQIFHSLLESVCHRLPPRLYA